MQWDDEQRLQEITERHREISNDVLSLRARRGILRTSVLVDAMTLTEKKALV